VVQTLPHGSCLLSQSVNIKIAINYLLFYMGVKFGFFQEKEEHIQSIGEEGSQTNGEQVTRE
jgi:hypothetical protein